MKMSGNENLIMSMMICDGTRKNCERCVFKEHPECRNALAHHAGALIQLQDVVIENTGRIQRKLLIDRERLNNRCEQDEDALRELEEAHKLLIRRLRDLKHCDTCDVRSLECPEKEREERCKACKAGSSQWALDLTIVTPEPENPCEECENDDCEGCEYNGVDDVKRID